ncbi:hypothetical protein [Puniceibacterium confluentis]|uniref:hypothetical protein n=2 Tax=Puniceibacterium confluentis TaxID=1958944 RepID=UPI0011B7436D|nr:hypothetical protein [Puniceibacterium confluentis]
MQLRATLVILLLCLLATTVRAGPWPRERGTWFAASDMRFSWARDIALRDGATPASAYYGTYLEYGLPRKLTLGLDLGRTGRGDTKSIAFLRVPLRNPETGLKVSAELGLGKIDDRAIVRPGLSLGLGFAAFGGQGWFSADTLAEVASKSRDTDFKLDLTFGVTRHSGTKLILQVQSGQPQDNVPFARLAPSIVIPMGHNRLLDLGLMYGITGDDTFGVKLGLWQTF